MTLVQFRYYEHEFNIDKNISKNIIENTCTAHVDPISSEYALTFPLEEWITTLPGDMVSNRNIWEALTEIYSYVFTNFPSCRHKMKYAVIYVNKEPVNVCVLFSCKEYIKYRDFVDRFPKFSLPYYNAAICAAFPVNIR